MASLPFKEENLGRKDALGSTAKREAAHYYTKRVKHCKRWLALNEEEVEFYRDRQGEENFAKFRDGLQKCIYWKLELKYARERLEEVEKLVMEAWE
jgi:succinate dehydrogenase/fumarate reductase flavoprotein subunit